MKAKCIKSLCSLLNFRTSEDTLILFLIDYKKEENPDLMSDTTKPRETVIKWSGYTFQLYQFISYVGLKNKLDTFSVISDGKQWSCFFSPPGYAHNIKSCSVLESAGPFHFLSQIPLSCSVKVEHFS